MEYTIVESGYAPDLCEMVNEKLAAGWTLHGAPVVRLVAAEPGYGLPQRTALSQAMIKVTNDPT